MFYVLLNQGYPTDATTEYPGNDAPWCQDGRDGWVNRNDWKTFDDVVRLTMYLNAMNSDKTFLPVDRGSHCSPRYDIVLAPRIGDEVSYSFNGDTYPCGKVVHITPTWRVVTEDERGNKKLFTHKKNSGSWVNNGTWSLIGGHHYEQNPSF